MSPSRAGASPGHDAGMALTAEAGVRPSMSEAGAPPVRHADAQVSPDNRFPLGNSARQPLDPDATPPLDPDAAPPLDPDAAPPLIDSDEAASDFEMTPISRSNGLGSWRPLLGFALAADVGTLPVATMGIGVDAGVMFRSWMWRIALYKWLSRDATTPASPSGGGGTFGFWSVLLETCPIFPQSWGDIGTCWSLETGVLSGQGASSLDFSRPQSAVWLALGAGATLRLRPANGWTIPIHLNLGLPLRRPEFVLVEESGSLAAVHRSSWAVVRAGIGIDFHF